MGSNTTFDAGCEFAVEYANGIFITIVPSSGRSARVESRSNPRIEFGGDMRFGS